MIMKSELVNFGQRVRYFRLQNNWSQETLAEKVNLHRTYIGSIERGERNISLINISLLAKAFSISISELLQGIDIQ